jgi:hypothetical protein
LEAEQVFVRALSIADRLAGSNHPSTARMMANYAILLRRMKRKAEATKLELRSRSILASHRQSNLLGLTIDASQSHPKDTSKRQD